MIVGVTDVTGLLGRRVASGLKGRIGWTNVFALARSPDEIERMDPNTRALPCGTPDGLRAALAQLDRLLIVGSREPGPSEAWHAELVDAAGDAGVGRIVYMSLLHADTSPLPGAAAHLRTEAMIARSGTPATILRVGCFAEDYLREVPRMIATGRFPGSAGDAQFSAAAVGDYAFAAASVITEDGHEGLVYELAGDRPWTLPEIAAEVAWHTCREIVYEHLSPQDHAESMRASGLSAEAADARVALDAAVAAGALLEEGRQLGRLRTLPTQSLTTGVWGGIESSGVKCPPFRGLRPGTDGRLKRVPKSLSEPRRLV